jgi:heme exporter protein C
MNRAIPILGALAAIGFAITVYAVFTYAPFEPTLLFNQKIFYYHVPQAFMLFASVTVCGLCSLVFLKNRKPAWDDLALASAEVAVLFGAAMLITGSIWGEAAWDKWWVWEKRLTMSLLLWLVLIGYVLVRRFAGASGDRLGAGLAVFGTIGIPFVYTMVDKGDHHPQAGKQGNVMTLTGPMKIVFWGSVFTFFLWMLSLLFLRVQLARAERELRELREKALDAGLFT